MDHDAELSKAISAVTLSRLFLISALAAGVVLCNSGAQAQTGACRTPQLLTSNDRYAVCVTSERVEFWTLSRPPLSDRGKLIAHFALTDRRARPMKPRQFLEHVSRESILVTFQDALEGWELFFGTNAPVIYEGFVHDYRSGEALPETGSVRQRRIIFPAPPIEMRHSTGAVLEIEATARRYYFNLDVRREVATPNER